MPARIKPPTVEQLARLADAERAAQLQRYFKTGVGEYGEGDHFIGVPVPRVREVAKQCAGLTLPQLRALLSSAWHEERQLALLVMVAQYRKGTPAHREALHALYLENTAHINNWDLVDVSAGTLVGAHLAPSADGLIGTLARSPLVWERRIAIIATGTWIRQGVVAPTLQLATRLLHDEHPLMHKAVGWMLRTVGDVDRRALDQFLATHRTHMPRTMLRYAIEHHAPSSRTALLKRNA
jgi:3-methyladenine DNA glycosylase AlkD